jgi:hypothetical protein
MALSDNQIDFDPHSEKNTDKGETQKEKKKQKNPSVKTSLRKWKDKKIKIDFVSSLLSLLEQKPMQQSTKKAMKESKRFARNINC